MNFAFFSRNAPFLAVALVAGFSAYLMPGQTGFSVIVVACVLASGLVTDLALSPLPSQYRTPWPMLLAWSVAWIALIHFWPFIHFLAK